MVGAPAASNAHATAAGEPAAATRGAPGGAAPERGIAWGDVAALAVIAVLEAGMIGTALTRSGEPWLHVGAAHLLALAGMIVVLLRAARGGRETTMPLLALVSGAAIGPLGPLGAIVLELAGSGSTAPSPLIEAWYERIALSTVVEPETRLCDDVGVGRTLDLGAGAPAPFPTVMATGSLEHRQTVLGLIARHFHPAHVPSLKVALQSPEPVIRVQAAAVAAHVSPEVRRRYQAVAARVDAACRSPIEALRVLAEIASLQQSGLLDEAERLRAVEEAARLGDCVVSAAARRPLHLRFETDVAEAAELDTVLERLLLERRQFSSLRAHRSAGRVRRANPKARLKRLAVRRPHIEAAR